MSLSIDSFPPKEKALYERVKSYYDNQKIPECYHTLKCVVCWNFRMLRNAHPPPKGGGFRNAFLT